MCAGPDKAATEEFRNRTGPQRAYKVIRKGSARPYIFKTSGVPYHPGRNVDRRAVKTYLGYKRGCNRGFHCFLNRRAAVGFRNNGWHRGLTVVCVTFEPDDVIVAEKADGWIDRQVVVRALNISKRAWKQAGLPEEARREGGRSQRCQ